MNTILTTALSTITGLVIGYVVSKLKDYGKKNRELKENNKRQNEALKLLLQNNLTNIYFVYQKLGEIPDYVYRNWKNMFHIYKILGGNDFVDSLDNRMNKFKIVRTGLLKEG